MTNRKWHSGMLRTEDWWSVWLGLFFFLISLATIWGVDLVGWMARPRSWEWSDLMTGFDGAKLFRVAGAAYGDWHPVLAWLFTYVVFTALLTVGARFQGLDLRRFVGGFTVLYVLTWAAFVAGNEMHLATIDATMDGRNRYTEAGLAWGLQLGDGAAYLLALIVGLVIGNFVRPLAAYLREAAKPEWFIKTAIVFLGIKLGVMTVEATSFALDLILTGAAATFVAYMLFWPLVYAAARKLFGLRRDASAVLASGISICGVSAAIATGGAIRARPILPVTVSMLVVIFAMLELIVLPGIYTTLAPDQPVVNGAAMGMTVKTDGADAAAGALLDQLMVAGHLQATGEQWQEGWILSAALLTKIWIDVFIGIWAFLLALVWVYKVENRGGQVRIGASEIWFRFPKFVIGYFIAWLGYLAIAAVFPDHIDAAEVGADTVQSPMRHFMFMLTFVSMGILADFSKLKGLGKLALLYGLALVVIIAPIAYVVAWLFHRGLVPPLVGAAP